MGWRGFPHSPARGASITLIPVSPLVTLAATLGSLDGEDQCAAPGYILDYLRPKDIGIINIHLTKIGSGSSFYVLAIRKGPRFFGSDAIVKKHTIPASPGTGMKTKRELTLLC